MNTFKKLAAMAVAAICTTNVYADYIPSPVKDTQVSYETVDGKNNVTFSFTAPTTKEDAFDWFAEQVEMTEAIDSICIYWCTIAEYEETYTMGLPIKTFANPAKGAEVNWTMEDVAYGSYYYMIKVYVDETEDFVTEPTGFTVGQLANICDEPEAVVDSKDSYLIHLAAVVPTLNNDWEELTMPITKMEFYEIDGMTYEKTLLYAEEDKDMLEGGMKIGYDFKAKRDGWFSFGVCAFTVAGSNDMSTTMIYVGTDLPGTVCDLKAEKSETGFVLSWTAPSESANGGDMGDASTFTYTVSRADDEYGNNAIVLAEGLTALTYTDNYSPSVETSFCYVVVASNKAGDSYPAYTEKFLAGPAAALPFAENFDVESGFDGVYAEHNTWTSTASEGNYTSWMVTKSVYTDAGNIEPHNGAGLLSCNYTAWATYAEGTFNAYTSGHINFATAQAPVLTFWLYDQTSLAEGVAITLSVLVDETSVSTIELGKAEADGWRQVTVDLAAAKGLEAATITFRATASGRGCTPVIIDEIVIKEGDATGIASIENAAAQQMIYTLDGKLCKSTKSGLQIVGNKVILKK